jgi:hypothetical protein
MDSYTSSTHPRKPSARQPHPRAFSPSSCNPLSFFPCPFRLFPSMLVPLFPFLFNAVLPLIASSCLLFKPFALALLPSHLPTFSYDPPSSQTIAGCLFLTQISLIFPAALPLCSSNRSFVNISSFAASTYTAYLCLIHTPPADLQCLYLNKFSAKVPFLKLISFHCFLPLVNITDVPTSSRIRLLFYYNLYFTCPSI